MSTYLQPGSSTGANWSRKVLRPCQVMTRLFLLVIKNVKEIGPIWVPLGSSEFTNLIDAHVVFSKLGLVTFFCQQQCFDILFPYHITKKLQLSKRISGKNVAKVKHFVSQYAFIKLEDVFKGFPKLQKDLKRKRKSLNHVTSYF